MTYLTIIRISLAIAVLIVGGLIAMEDRVFADETHSTAVFQDRTVETTTCRSSDTTVTCYYAYCLSLGSGCSFYSGACFSIYGGYCCSGGGGDPDTDDFTLE